MKKRILLGLTTCGLLASFASAFLPSTRLSLDPKVKCDSVAEATAGSFVKITSTGDLTDGDYLIVYEDGNVAFNGALETLDAVNNTIAVTITEGSIPLTDGTKASYFSIDNTAHTIMSASGFYIGRTANSNGLNTSGTEQYKNTIAFDNGDAVITAPNGTTLRYNKSKGQDRFRYYTSGQQAIQLYKFVAESGGDPVKTIKISSKYAYTKVGTPLNFTAKFTNYETDPEIIFDSSDETVATITDEGVLTPLKYGKTTIMATDGDIDSNSIEITVYPDNTNAMSVSEVLEFMEVIYPKTSAEPMHYEYSTVGIVSSIEKYDSTNDNVTFNLADETDNTKILYCYQISGGSQLKVNDKIKVNGTIGTYKGKWEYLRNSTYELLEASKVKTINLKSATGKNYTMMGTDLQINAEFENYDADPEITFGSSDETVATITDEGVLTPVGVGTTLIQATDGDVLSDDLEITIYPDNTVDFSVTELLNFLPEVLDVSESGQLPYAYSTYGVVKSIKTAYNSTNNNISIVLADVDDDTKTISCYKLSGGEDLQVGDNIKVTGTINTYQNDYQYMAGSTYVPFEKVLTPKEKLAKKNTVSSLYYKYTKTTDGEAVTDTLNYAATGISGTGYSEWSGKTGTSGAVYAGQSGGTYSSIQLRTNNSNSGIVTTTSGGKAAKVTVKWNENTSAGRVLDIYGSNTAYTATTDLYDVEKQGTLLGSIAYGTETELEITGDYTYIGVRSHDGALYLDKLNIQWGGAASYTIDEAAIRYGAVIEKSLYAELGNVTSYGVILGSESGLAEAGKNSLKAFYEAYSTKANFEVIKNNCKIKDFNYTDEQATADDEEQLSALGITEPCYVYNVFVDLKDHLTTDIYALAYVEIDGERVFLNEVNYSVASLAKAYIDKGVKDASAYEGSLNYLASLVA